MCEILSQNCVPSVEHSLRPAVPSDASDLLVLADVSSRCLFSWVWGEASNSGQSALELAHRSIQTDLGSVSHCSNWDVIEHNGAVVAGLNSYLLLAVVEPEDTQTRVAMVTRPLNQLKTIAEGSWYIASVSVFVEGRGIGAGTTLIEVAERKARQSGVEKLSLMVGSFNKRARELYERMGFTEWDRREFIPFPGADSEGFWILMVKRIQ